MRRKEREENWKKTKRQGGRKGRRYEGMRRLEEGKITADKQLEG